MDSLAQVILELEGEEGVLSEQGTRAGLILLAGMLLSFVLIRTSARLMRSPKVPWWPGSVTPGGLHIHHLVFGIVLMLLAGFVMALQPGEPWFEITAGAFGVGAGLTLDEFALWLHLEDVYWSEAGRRSVDAIVVASLVAGLVLLGFLPFSTEDSGPAIVFGVLLNLGLAGIAVFKGKLFMGIAGVLFPLVSIIAAIRLAKPESPWARRFYKPGSKKLARSEARYEKHTRRYRRFQDQIAGAPTAGHPSDSERHAPIRPP
ncbi:MAG TPA: hypothetical protein VHJ37_01055 [Thermoleophilaceae bacterium]|nr:hypothetical protein [Thermoleophilaceae bacterium]